MIKSKYIPKVGDRVRLIGYDLEGLSVDDMVGTVTDEPDETGDAWVDTAARGYVGVKPSQCRLRRFKKKAEPKKAREWKGQWKRMQEPEGRIGYDMSFVIPGSVENHKRLLGQRMKLREVLPGERTYRDGLVAALGVVSALSIVSPYEQGNAIRALIDKEDFK